MICDRCKKRVKHLSYIPGIRDNKGDLVPTYSCEDCMTPKEKINQDRFMKE